MIDIISQYKETIPVRYRIPHAVTLLKGGKTKMFFRRRPSSFRYQWNNKHSTYLCLAGLIKMDLLDYLESLESPKTILFHLTCQKPENDNYFLKLDLIEGIISFSKDSTYTTSLADVIVPTWLRTLRRFLKKAGFEYLYITKIDYTY